MTEKKSLQKKLDSWSNLVTGMGRQKTDKLENTRFGDNFILDRAELTNIFRSGGMGKRVVTLPVNDMIRGWFTIVGDSDNKIINWMDEKLNIRNIFSEQMTWARLYGGAIGIMLIDDGKDLDEELSQDTIVNFESITIYDRHKVTWSTQDIYSDSYNPKFGEPFQYYITPVTGMPFYVHETRVLKLDGERLPQEYRQLNQGWDDSVLQNPYNSLRDLGSSLNAITHIIDEFVMGILSIDNLMNLIQQGETSAILKRLHLMDMTKRVSNTTILDTDEKFEKVTSTVSGLDQLIDKLILSVSASTGIPVSLLTGQSPKGLNAGGAVDADIQYYYANVSLIQTLKMRSYFNSLINIVMLNKNGPTKGTVEDYTIEFNPLWQPTQKEIIETRKIQAEIDEKYIQMGVLDAQEVGLARFGGISYSYDTKEQAILKDNRGVIDVE